MIITLWSLLNDDHLPAIVLSVSCIRTLNLHSSGRQVLCAHERMSTPWARGNKAMNLSHMMLEPPG